MILSLDVLAEKLIRAHKAHKGLNHLPKRIIFYRDGVSEGQFQAVLQYELPALRKALERVGGEQYAKACKIAFIVAQKRHHTRFFLADERLAPPRGNGNIPSVRAKGTERTQESCTQARGRLRPP